MDTTRATTTRAPIDSVHTETSPGSAFGRPSPGFARAMAMLETSGLAFTEVISCPVPDCPTCNSSADIPLRSAA